MSNKDHKCKFCDNKPPTKRDSVCRDHSKLKCPKCGHIAFWIAKGTKSEGRYVCLYIYCNWESDKLP